LAVKNSDNRARANAAKVEKKGQVSSSMVKKGSMGKVQAHSKDFKPAPRPVIFHHGPAPKLHIHGGHKYYDRIHEHARFFHHGKHRYYVHNGLFYLWHAKLGYELITRPILTFATLPFTCVQVHIGSTPYWYSDGIWFAKKNTQYVIIDRPISPTQAVVLSSLPFNCEIISINGVTYYYGENTWFMPHGKQFIIVDAPEVIYDDTNFIAELPQGSKRVIVNQRLYWFGADTWFQAVDGGYVIIDSPLLK
jgi:hypothetical protein